MSTLALKIVGGTVLVGSLGTGAYFGAKELLKNPTIEEQLKSEKFKFISFDDSAQWTEEFNSDSTNIKATLGEDVNNGEKLRDKCKSLMSSDSVKNKSDIENAKKWCGIRSISSQLKRKGKTFLVGLAGANEEVNKKWTATYQKRRADATDRDNLGLPKGWPLLVKNDIEELKPICKKKGNDDYLAKSKEEYTAVENWCTVEGAEVTVPKV